MFTQMRLKADFFKKGALVLCLGLLSFPGLSLANPTVTAKKSAPSLTAANAKTAPAFTSKVGDLKKWIPSKILGRKADLLKAKKKAMVFSTLLNLPVVNVPGQNACENLSEFQNSMTKGVASVFESLTQHLDYCDPANSNSKNPIYKKIEKILNTASSSFQQLVECKLAFGKEVKTENECMEIAATKFTEACENQLATFHKKQDDLAAKFSKSCKVYFEYCKAHPKLKGKEYYCCNENAYSKLTIADCSSL